MLFLFILQFHDKYNAFIEINLCTQEVSSLSYLLFDFSPIKKAGKVKLFGQKARNHLFHVSK